MDGGKVIMLVVGVILVWMGLLSIFTRKATTEKTWKRGELFIPKDAEYSRAKGEYRKTTEHSGSNAVAIGLLQVGLGACILYFALSGSPL